MPLETISAQTKSIAKVLAKTFFLAFLSGLVGFILNVCLLIFLAPEIKTILRQTLAAMPGANAGGIAIIIILFIIMIRAWPVTVMFVLFLIVFPVGYFFITKAYIFSKELHASMLKNKEIISTLIFDIGKEAFQKISNAEGIKKSWERHKHPLKTVKSLIKNKDDLPKPIRFLVLFIFKKTKIDEITKKFNDSLLADLNEETRHEKIKTEIATYLTKRFRKPSPLLISSCFLVNLALFIFIKLYV